MSSFRDNGCTGGADGGSRQYQPVQFTVGRCIRAARPRSFERRVHWRSFSAVDCKRRHSSCARGQDAEMAARTRRVDVMATVSDTHASGEIKFQSRE